jgi:hypothetical protein
MHLYTLHHTVIVISVMYTGSVYILLAYARDHTCLSDLCTIKDVNVTSDHLCLSVANYKDCVNMINLTVLTMY